jgi:hypothetical protein
MKPNEQSPPTAVVVIVQMNVIGSGPILTDKANMHTPMLDEMPIEVSSVTDVGSNGEVNEEFEPPPHPKRHCTCDNRLLPVVDQDLTSIKRSCPFPTGGSANSLPPNEKRNIVYWWYATNIFLICGKGYRGPLPECLVYAIRCCYPKPKGVEYVGFLEKEEKQMQKRNRCN